MHFETYPDKHGYLKQRNVLLFGPREPGTLIAYVPTVARMDLRLGMIVAVHSDRVDVVWNRWRENPAIQDGQLRQLMGIPNAEQRRQEKRRQTGRKCRRGLGECKSTGRCGRL